MAKKLTKTLRQVNPEAARMMDLMEKENEGLTPDNVGASSEIEAWFCCLDNPKHIFRKRIGKMTSSRDGHNIGCIYCGPNAKIAYPGENDFFTTVPSAKEMWAFDLNKDIDPYHLLSGAEGETKTGFIRVYETDIEYEIIEGFRKLDDARKNRLLGYLHALTGD